jgi:hypothetical protein
MYAAGVGSDRIDKPSEYWENRAARETLDNQDTLTSTLNRSATKGTTVRSLRQGSG